MDFVGKLENGEHPLISAHDTNKFVSFANCNAHMDEILLSLISI